MLEVGLRVIRGRNWVWNDQDGGDGFAGTIVDIGKSSSASNNNQAEKTPEKTAIVQWDHGGRSNYRIGYQDAYDLLVIDNAAACVKHPEVICNGCKIHGIFGMLWVCSKCQDYDLCTQCYMSDKHDLNHPFKRFQTSNSVGVEVGPRKNSAKVQLKGIFIGAKVVRGPDWEWGNQDGGQNKVGTVIDIRGWDNESGRSVATVTWQSGNTNVYRLGYKGCVDLCYSEPAIGGSYYREHLPLVGKMELTVSVDNAATLNANINTSPNASHLPFLVGDKVKVLMDVDTLKNMQSGHGGWNPRMAEYIGKIGTVHRVTDKGDIRVQYDGLNNRWTFHPGALTKVVSRESFSLGDIVKVKTDMSTVKHFQKNHGEWIDVMKSALGKCGKVIKIYGDGDMRVLIEGQTWTFNPLSVVLVHPASVNVVNPIADCNNRGGKVNQSEGTDVEVEKLLRDAARGKSGIPAIKEFLAKYPDRVDARGGPGGGRKTCLQVAAHQGQKELCVLLLEAGASLYAVDEDGDTPLHYAAFGNQPQIIELLLSRGAPIDATNNAKCSALHVAVNKQHAQCVKILLQQNCNVNLQDSYGDTTLHDAIGKDDLSIIDSLCSCDRVNFALQNKRGFNVLHHAALKGNLYAIQKLVERARHLVDIKKEDGFAAIHLCALNGHLEVAALLLSASGGRAKVDLQNNRKQTPLLLATSQGHWAIVELLINHQANVACADEDGDTALHIAINRKRRQSTNAITSDSICDSSTLKKIWDDLVRQNVKTELTLICYLVSCDSSNTILEKAKNSKGKTPLDLLQADPEYARFVDVIKSYKTNKRGNHDNRARSGSNTASSSAQASANQIGVVTAQLATLLDVGNEESKRCNNCQRQIEPNPEASKNRSSSVEGANGNCLECTHLYKNAEIQEYEQIKNRVSDKDVSLKAKDLARLRYLETRIADLEEANMCSICMERRRNVAFLCGHGACEACATPLKTCHMCRQTITKKINLY